MLVSIFKDVYEKKSPEYRDVLTVLKLIKRGRWANKIHQIRKEQDSARRAELKYYLPCICFSGMFTQRFDAYITKHSGLCILDFDHVEDLPKFKKEICEDEYTYAAFISPSGDGLKVLVKIPPEIEKENHEGYYNGLIEKYPSLDSTSKNPSRVCFASYDPDLYLNEKSRIFKKKIKEIKVPVMVPIINAQNTDYKKMDRCVEIIRNSVDGSKHKDLIKASRLAGGFISGGLVEEYIAISILEFEINNKNIKSFPDAARAIRKGIEYGKATPITESNYNQKYDEIIRTEIIVEDEPAKDVIYLDDVREKIKYTYHHGTSRGETTHFEEIDKVYRMKRGEVTLIYGIGNHGKSEAILQIALIKAVKDDYKWGVFSPENMPEEEFYKNLIHAYIGKSTEKHHKNQMSEEELEKGMDFISSHFFLIYPKNDSPTPAYINNRFRELIIKHNIDGCIVDPYNQLENDLAKNGGREDQYILKTITACIRFANENDVFYYIVAHPKGQGMFKDKNTGDYECPNVFDLAGGAMWNNACHNIIVIHRPFYTSDKENTTVMFKSQKIKKQKLNGVPGDVVLSFNRATGRYVDEYGFSPLGHISEDPLSFNFIGKEFFGEIKPLLNFHESKQVQMETEFEETPPPF